MTAAWRPIHRLLAAGRPAKTVVAQGLAAEYRWSDLEGHVAGLCAQLASKPRGRWLLSCDSAYAFSVGLLALWQTGRVAVLPPNLQPESLRESARGTQGLISDAMAPAVTKKAGAWKTVDPARTRLELFTSGSTGDRRSVPKTLAQLEAELARAGKNVRPPAGRLHGACQRVASPYLRAALSLAMAARGGPAVCGYAVFAVGGVVIPC